MDEPTSSKPVFFALIAPREARSREGARMFAEEVEGALAAGSTRLLVDLTDVQRVRTSVFNALLSARARLWSDGGRIAVVVSPGLKRFIEATGLDRRFLIASDRLGAARLLGLSGLSGPALNAPSHRVGGIARG